MKEFEEQEKKTFLASIDEFMRIAQQGIVKDKGRIDEENFNPFASILGLKKSAKEYILEIKNDEYYEGLRKYINNAFKPLESDDFKNEIKKYGIDSPFDLFRVDGKPIKSAVKTNAEGKPVMSDLEKEAKELDDADKDLFYKFYILSIINLKKNEVTIDSYVPTSKKEKEKAADSGKAVKEYKLASPVKVNLSNDSIAHELAFFYTLDTIRKDLISFRDRLIDTHPADKKNAIFDDTSIMTGSDTYQAMAKALKDCIDLTDFQSSKGTTLVEIKAAMERLKQASDEYYKMHTGWHGITAGYRDNGKERIRVSDALRNELFYDIEKLDDVAINSQINTPYKNDEQKAYYKTSAIWDRLKTVTAKRENPVNYEMVEDLISASNKFTNRAYSTYVANSSTKESCRQAIEADRPRFISQIETQNDKDQAGVRPKNFTKKRAEMAEKIVKKYFLDLVKKADVVEGGLTVSDLKFSGPGFQKMYKDKVENLQLDEDFTDIMVNYPDEVEKKWENRMLKRENAKFKDLAQNNDAFKELINEDPKNARAKWKAAEYRLERWRASYDTSFEAVVSMIKHKDSVFSMSSPVGLIYENTNEGFEYREKFRSQREEIVERLADLLVFGDVRSKLNDPYQMSIALDPKKIEEYKGYIKEGLKDKVVNSKTIKVLNDELSGHGLTKKLVDMAKGFIQKGIDKKNNPVANNEANKNVKAEPVKAPGK
ncbi:MAG: hypothetical protein K5656_09660 [Lachnospiraceae bacterium]|nr:hypothetical protein [Lachnospiraceae bacterium]